MTVHYQRILNCFWNDQQVSSGTGHRELYYFSKADSQKEIIFEQLKAQRAAGSVPDDQKT